MIAEYIRGLLEHDIELRTSSFDSTKGKLVDISDDGWAVVEKRGESHFISFYLSSLHVTHRARRCARCTAERYLPATTADSSLNAARNDGR